MNLFNWLLTRTRSRDVSGKRDQGAPNRKDAGTVLRSTPAPSPASYSVAEYEKRLSSLFTIKQQLGAGGMGRVYLADHPAWGVEVAVKIPNPAIMEDTANRHRISREAEAWTDLGLHPNIAYCYYVQPLEELIALVVEYVDGGSLRDWIADGRCADLKTGLDLAIQCCHGLEHAHSRGLIHRDVKPENLLVTKRGNLKITDFGIARRSVPDKDNMSLATGGINGTVAGIGTYDYMPPEQFVTTVDVRADIFALGVCLYEMFCGRRPYSLASGPRQVAPDAKILRGDDSLPKALAELMKRCVDWEPNQRPATAAAVCRELNAIYAEQFGERSVYAEIPKVSLEAEEWNNRAISYLELRNESSALESFDRALALNFTHLQATFNKALFQWKRGDINDLEVLQRLDHIRASQESTEDRLDLALAISEIHQQRLEPEASRNELTPYIGLYEKHWSGRESTQVALMMDLPGHSDGAEGVAISPDGRRALTAKFNLKFSDLESGDCLASMSERSEDARTCALTPDAQIGLSGGMNGSVKTWNLATGNCLRVLRAKGERVRSVAITADGKLVVAVVGNPYQIPSPNWRNLIYMWHAATGDSLEPLQGGEGLEYNSLAFTSDGRQLLVGGKSTLELWNLEWRRLERTLDGLGPAAITPDGERALSCGPDKTLRFWSLKTGKCLQIMKSHSRVITSVAITANGQYGLSGSVEGALTIWNLETGECMLTRQAYSSPAGRFSSNCIQSVAISHDGTKAIVSCDDQPVKLWTLNFSRRYQSKYKLCQPREFSELQSAQASRDQAISHIEDLITKGEHHDAYSNLMQSWAKIDYAREVRLERLYTRLCERRSFGDLLAAVPRFTTQVGERIVSVAVTPDGRRAFVSLADQTLVCWDLEGSRLLHNLKDHKQVYYKRISSVALTLNGRRGISSDADTDFKPGVLKVWDLEDGRCLHTLEGDLYGVDSVAITADGMLGLSGGQDCSVRLWDLAAGRCLGIHCSPVKEYPAGINIIKPSYGSVRPASVTDSRREMQDVSTTFDGHSRTVSAVAVTPDGKLGVSGSRDKTLKVWDLGIGPRDGNATFRCLETFYCTEQVQSCALTPDARWMLVGTNGTLEFWDINARARRFADPQGCVTSVAITDDGRRGVSVTRDSNDVAVWDLEACSRLRTLSVAGRISSIAMTNDGLWLIIGQEDGTLTLWRLVWTLESPASC